MVAAFARIARVLVGVLVSSWAFLWIVHAHLGTGPWHVVQQGIAAHFGIALGSAVWVTGAVFFVAALCTGERPGVATLAAVLLGGVYINALAGRVHDVHGSVARVVALIQGWLRVLRAMPQKRPDVLAGLHAEPDIV